MNTAQSINWKEKKGWVDSKQTSLISIDKIKLMVPFIHLRSKFD